MKIRTIPLILALTLFPVTNIYLQGCSPKVTTETPSQHQAKPLTLEEIKQLATAITVKVKTGDTVASGTLIKQENNNYIVVTNRHVIENGKDYQIITYDGMIHNATIKDKSDQYDLALLEFNSNNNYQVATIGNFAEIKLKDQVYGVGYFYNAEDIIISEGKYSLSANPSLKGGYEIGYSNQIKPGMSGGAILDIYGNMIGINGRKNNPVLQDYQYMDGSQPDENLKQQMIALSWGIPVTFIDQFAPQLALIPTSKGGNNSTVEINPNPPELARLNNNEITKKVNENAAKITVKINNNGSGVIVAKEGNTYIVATADHVINDDNIKYQVTTPDGKTHPVTKKYRFQGVDLGVVKFESKENYQVATLAKASLKPEEIRPIFVSGYPGDTPNRNLTFGFLKSKERGALSLTKENAAFLSNSFGYDMIYTALSLPGMSGGAVLDTEGRLIGINAGIEGEYTDSGEIQLGYSFGVPILTFEGLANRAKITSQITLVENQPSELNNTNDLIALFIPHQKPDHNAKEREWLNYGNQLWRLGKYEDAITAFDKAILIKPDFYQAYYSKGIALYYKGEYIEAIQSYKKVIEINPEFYQALLYWGNILVEILDGYENYKDDYKDKLNDVLLIYDQAIAINNTILNNEQKKQDYRLYIGRGIILSKLQRYSEALETYTIAINLNPNSLAYGNRGLTYYELEQYQQALNDNNESLKLNPSYNLYHNQGNTYYELKQYQQAIENYSKAIKINPNFAEAYQGLAQAYRERAFDSYFRLKDYQKAIDDFSEVIKIDRNNALSYFMRGSSYAVIGDYKKALSDANKAAQLFQQQGNNEGYKEAQELIKKLEKDL